MLPHLWQNASNNKLSVVQSRKIDMGLHKLPCHYRSLNPITLCTAENTIEVTSLGDDSTLWGIRATEASVQAPQQQWLQSSDQLLHLPESS